MRHFSPFFSRVNESKLNQASEKKQQFLAHHRNSYVSRTKLLASSVLEIATKLGEFS